MAVEVLTFQYQYHDQSYAVQAWQELRTVYFANIYFYYAVYGRSLGRLGPRVVVTKFRPSSHDYTM